jgi:hypothetical protein
MIAFNLLLCNKMISCNDRQYITVNKLDVHGSVHRNINLIQRNQQDATV